MFAISSIPQAQSICYTSIRIIVGLFKFRTRAQELALMDRPLLHLHWDTWQSRQQTATSNEHSASVQSETSEDGSMDLKNCQQRAFVYYSHKCSQPFGPNDKEKKRQNKMNKIRFLRKQPVRMSFPTSG